MQTEVNNMLLKLLTLIGCTLSNKRLHLSYKDDIRYENLVLLRTLKGYSQEEIAEKIDISRQAYAKWEKGETVPDVEKCNKLAMIYNTTIDNLINFESTGGDVIIPPAPKGKYIWGTVTISERGQIVIPKAAREHFDLKAGNRMVVLGSDGEGIALVPAEIFEKNLEYLMKRGNEPGIE